MTRTIEPISRPMVALVALFIFAGLAMGQESCETESGGGDGDAPENAGDGANADCTFRATDDCTPRVGQNGKVRVDALVWRVTGASTAQSLGDVSLGLGEKANGTFVVVNVKVTSKKDESATLTDESIKLQAGKKTYSADSSGTVAAIGEGQDPLFLEDIGPDSTVESKVVYDVPQSVLSKKVYVRFNELGFGTTHAFIKLPRSAQG